MIQSRAASRLARTIAVLANPSAEAFQPVRTLTAQKKQARRAGLTTRQVAKLHASALARGNPLDDPSLSSFADQLSKTGGKVTGNGKDTKATADAKVDPKAAAAKAADAKAATAEVEKMKKEHAEALASRDAKAKELEEKVKELTRTAQEYKEKHLASLADKDNLVKITRRDIENAKDFGIKSFVIKLLDVVDTINICLDNVKDPDAREALESIKIQFVKVLGDVSVEEVAPKPGDKFDVNFHNAMFEMEPTAVGHTAKSIGMVLKNGWVRKGQLLRAAAVGVYNSDYKGDATKEPTPESSNL